MIIKRWKLDNFRCDNNHLTATCAIKSQFIIVCDGENQQIMIDGSLLYFGFTVYTLE